MQRLRTLLTDRFGDDLPTAQEDAGLSAHEDALIALAQHRSHRRFKPSPVSTELLKTIAAVALCAPSKSDLQQRDIVIIDDQELLAGLKELIADQAWTANIPAMVVVCGNNRRQRQLHALRGHAFANDHLDAFFNAAVDAGIALQAFISAAEAAGLGCCPISAVRNRAQEASTLLRLPDHVFPVAGLAVGWPENEGQRSDRLPLRTTVHVNHFGDSQIADDVASYDARRAHRQPYRSQRAEAQFGTLAPSAYTWSEDKTRQYALPERADFGAFIRQRGFKLD